MKEIISLYIGQAGVQVGSSMWELFCAEHRISYAGVLTDDKLDAECIEALFQSISPTNWVPRSLFVDLEPSVVDEVRSGMLRNLFHPDRLLSGPEDAANNFSRGFFTVGKLLLGSINEQCRHLVEQCDMVQGMLILRSLGGGTGAGLTSAMFEGLSEYPKTPKVEVPIYPSPTLSTSMVEPYNCLLGEHFCMEDVDVGLLLDNEAMFEMCTKYLSICYPTYNTINRMIAQVVSSITASVRFINVLNCDLTVLQTNLVPYPRIHFPLCNFAPIMNQERANHQELSPQDLTRMVFDRDNQMMKVDPFYGKFMSCALFFRGNICPHHVYLALSEIKRDKNIEFVDWCPTGFKVGITSASPVIIPSSQFADTTVNVAMLTNSSAIGQAWQRLTHRFYLLYSKRSFVHWFVGEGMEECEFTEALYNISALVKDYEEAGESTKTNNDNTLTNEKDISQENNTKSTDTKNTLSNSNKESKGKDSTESITLRIKDEVASNSVLKLLSKFQGFSNINDGNMSTINNQNFQQENSINMLKSNSLSINNEDKINFADSSKCFTDNSEVIVEDGQTDLPENENAIVVKNADQSNSIKNCNSSVNLSDNNESLSNLSKSKPKVKIMSLSSCKLMNQSDFEVHKIVKFDNENKSTKEITKSSFFNNKKKLYDKISQEFKDDHFEKKSDSTNESDIGSLQNDLQFSSNTSSDKSHTSALEILNRYSLVKIEETPFDSDYLKQTFPRLLSESHRPRSSVGLDLDKYDKSKHKYAVLPSPKSEFKDEGELKVINSDLSVKLDTVVDDSPDPYLTLRSFSTNCTFNESNQCDNVEEVKRLKIEDEVLSNKTSSIIDFEDPEYSQFRFSEKNAEKSVLKSHSLQLHHHKYSILESKPKNFLSESKSLRKYENLANRKMQKHKYSSQTSLLMTRHKSQNKNMSLIKLNDRTSNVLFTIDQDQFYSSSKTELQLVNDQQIQENENVICSKKSDELNLTSKSIGDETDSNKQPNITNENGNNLQNHNIDELNLKIEKDRTFVSFAENEKIIYDQSLISQTNGENMKLYTSRCSFSTKGFSKSIKVELKSKDNRNSNTFASRENEDLCISVNNSTFERQTKVMSKNPKILLRKCHLPLESNKNSLSLFDKNNSQLSNTPVVRPYSMPKQRNLKSLNKTHCNPSKS